MPDWKNEIREHLAGLRLAPAREVEIVEELAQCLEDCYQELRANGHTEVDARRKTLKELNESDLLTRELNKIERQIKHEPVALGARRINLFSDLFRDLRFGVRMLAKSKGFTIVSVLSAASSIRATSCSRTTSSPLPEIGNMPKASGV